MAVDVPDYRPSAVFTASGDLSASQFSFVKNSSTARQVVVCSVAGELALGVLQNMPASGTEAIIEMGRGAAVKVRLGGTVAVNDLIGTDTSGRAVTVDPTPGGADVGKWVLGLCVEGGAVNKLGTVVLLACYPVPPAA